MGEGRVNVLDLFSGIGGFSLGLERAGMRTVAFCEIDPACRRVLAKHWPDVPCFRNIRELGAGQLVGMRIDVICGGFPCQPFSSASAGKAYGAEHDDYLWPEMLRVISEVRPRWVIGENVAHIDRLALEQVVSDLEACGYETAPPLVIPACAVGHDHRRDRFWFIGHSNRDREPWSAEYAKASGVPWPRNDAGSMGAADGLSSRMDRMRMLGNAVVPAIAETIGRAIIP